jgi:hypothetical protein
MSVQMAAEQKDTMAAVEGVRWDAIPTSHSHCFGSARPNFFFLPGKHTKGEYRVKNGACDMKLCAGGAREPYDRV